MQRTQLNVATLLLLLLAGASVSAAGPISRPTPPDPLLGGGNLLDSRPGPCADLAAGADYVAGTDAVGNPVIPADAGTPPVPVPDGIAIPLGRQQEARPGVNPMTGGGMGGTFVEMDGRRLAPLLNQPACRR